MESIRSASNAMYISPEPWTFSQVKKLRYSYFDTLDAEKKKEQIETFRYIEQMALGSQINIDDWDLAHFGDPESMGLLITDRNAINIRLFQLADKYKQEKNDQLARNLLTVKEKLLVLGESLKVQRLSRQDRVYRDSLSSAHNYYSEYETYLKKAWDAHRETTLIRDGKFDTLSTEVEKILVNDFWEFREISGSMLTLVTAKDILMIHRNRAAGLDLNVNFGRFQLSIDLSAMRVSVVSHKRNLFCRGYYHTYISSEGSVCWGNAADEVARLLAKGKLAEVIEILSALLVNYYPEATPYCCLEDFQRIYDETLPESLRSGLSSANYCFDCSNPMDDCDCERCELCEEPGDDCECWTCESCDSRIRSGEACENCCSNCNNYYDNCSCCGVCGDSDRDNCDCCQECESSERRCRRCRDCGEHTGHDTSCPQHEGNQQAPTEQAPF
jgi:hypothetical protein